MRTNIEYKHRAKSPSIHKSNHHTYNALDDYGNKAVERLVEAFKKGVEAETHNALTDGSSLFLLGGAVKIAEKRGNLLYLGLGILNPEDIVVKRYFESLLNQFSPPLTNPFKWHLDVKANTIEVELWEVIEGEFKCDIRFTISRNLKQALQFIDVTNTPIRKKGRPRKGEVSVTRIQAH